MAELEFIGDIVGLRRSIAKRNGKRDSGGIVRKIPAKDLRQNAAVSADEIRVRGAGGAWKYRIQGPAQAVVGKLGKSLQTRQESVLVPFGQELLAFHVDLELHHVRTVGKSLLHQFRNGPDVVRFRNYDMVQRNDVDIVQPRVLHAVPVQRILQDNLLLRYIGLRD